MKKRLLAGITCFLMTIVMIDIIAMATDSRDSEIANNSIEAVDILGNGDTRDSDDIELQGDGERSGKCSDKITWMLDDNGTLTISGTGYTDWFYNGMDKAPWYEYRNEIIRIEITEGVADICGFADCINLVDVTIPSSATFIWSSAFRDCRNLETINIPEGVTQIGGYTFSGCERLKSISLPNTLKTIGTYDFYNCVSLEMVSLPKGIEIIPTGLFYGCRGLETVNIPDTVKDIEYNAFCGCESLKQIDIPKDVEVIHINCFGGCKNLFSVTLPSTLKEIETNAFNGCERLSGGISIPAGQTYVGKETFKNCCSLESIEIPDSVTTIGESAFEGCTALSQLIIPTRVTALPAGTFKGCSNIESISISESVSEIGESVFEDCSNLNSIKLPQKITCIPKKAFKGCTKLKKIDLTDDVTEISEMAFMDCSGLDYFKIPSGIQEISYQTFDDCTNMKYIVIPLSVCTISEDFNGCDQLLEIYYEGTRKDWGDVSKCGLPEKIRVYYESLGPNEEIKKCGDKTKWALDGETLFISGSGAMFDFLFDDGGEGDVTIPWWNVHTQIMKAEIGKGVTNIGACSFIHHYELSEVHIPKSVTEIGDSVFYATFVKDIYYAGTEDDWKKIRIGKENETINNATIHFEKDVEIEENSAVPKDDGKLYEVPVNSFSIHNGESTVPLEIEWTFEDFKDSAYNYNHRLAIAGLALSASANNSTDNNTKPITEALESFGFDRIINWNYESNNLVNCPGISFGSKAIKVDGEKKLLVAVVIRGTTTASDFKTDANALVNGFSEAGRIASEYLKDYIDNRADIDSTVLFITGHSLGAATAGVLTQRIGSIAYKTDTYVYTYASPNYDLTDEYYSYANNPINVHTIINVDDSVPNMIVTKSRITNREVWTNSFHSATVRINKDKEYNRENEGAIFDSTYKKLTGYDKSYNQLMNDRSLWYNLPIPIARIWNGLNLGFLGFNNTSAAISHAVETYMAFLLTHAPSNSISPRMMKILKIECPVDVEIYNEDGSIYGRIVNNVADFYENSDIAIETDEDKKYILIPYRSDYSVVLTATDQGTLKYTVTEKNVTGVDSKETIFDNVQLEKNKKFTSELEMDKPKELLVVDDNGVPVKTVLEDGKEIKYNAFGDILESDVPSDGIIPDGIWIAGVTDMAYTGKALTQEFRVYDGITMLVPKTDYTVKYKNNKKSYTISDPDNPTTDDKKKAPQILITMKGNYSGKETVYFSINSTGKNLAKVDTKPYSITGDKISVTDTLGNNNLSAVYDKSGAKPSIRVMYEDTILKEGRDYTLKFSANISYPAKRASVTITGMGNYTNKRTIPITITQRPFSEGTGITVVATDKAEGKKAGQYTTTVKVFDSEGKLLKAGTDYDKKITYLKDGVELTKTDYPKAGDEITVRITGKGGYTDNSIDATYKIVPAGQVIDISKATFKIKQQQYNKGTAVTISEQEMFDQAFIGKSKTPLRLSTDGGATGDFMVVPGSYTKNTNKGTAKVTFMGINGKTGTKTVSFSIGTRSVKDIWYGWGR